MGSYAASRLAGAGHKVLVLERQRGLGENVCCTGIIGQECVYAFAVEPDVILRWANSAKLVSPSEKVLRVWRKEPQACIVDRTAFDVMMANRAQGAGAEYLLGNLVRDIDIEGDRVRIEAYQRGKTLTFEARAVVIATGFGVGLSRKLGLGQFGDFVVGAQSEVETTGVEEVEVYFGRRIAPGFFAWLVPTSARTARVGLLSRRKPGQYLQKLLSSLLAEGKIVASEFALSYGGIPLKPLPRTCGTRLVVVGDAAGQVKPTTGGGIYYGLLCAEIAASVLHKALEDNDLSVKRLAQYEQAWKQRLVWELRVDYWARKLFERLGDAQLDRMFALVKANGIDEALLNAKDLSFDWHRKAVVRLLRRVAAAKIKGSLKIPFRSRGD